MKVRERENGEWRMLECSNVTNVDEFADAVALHEVARVGRVPDVLEGVARDPACARSYAHRRTKTHAARR